MKIIECIKLLTVIHIYYFLLYVPTKNYVIFRRSEYTEREYGMMEL